MIIDVANYTCRGGHEINEDSHFVGEHVFAVADGLGGHANGEEASACAIQYIQENCKGNFDDRKILEMLNATNQAVLDLNSPARTTIAAALVEDGIFRYANVGDSRVYYFRNGKVYAQTKGHSVCQALVDMGNIRQEDIRKSEDRSRLLKVLGNDKDLNLKKTYPAIEMQDGDAFLICSDGFWEFVYEKEMEEDLQKSGSAEKWMKSMLERQLQRAKNEDDNYTVICGIARANAAGKKSRNALVIAVVAILTAAVAGGIGFAYWKNPSLFHGNSDVSGNEAATETDTGEGADEGESAEPIADGMESMEGTDGADSMKGENADGMEGTEESADGAKSIEESTDGSKDTDESAEGTESAGSTEGTDVDKEDVERPITGGNSGDTEGAGNSADGTEAAGGHPDGTEGTGNADGMQGTEDNQGSENGDSADKKSISDIIGGMGIGD